jgi:hypothetical protein
MLLNNNESIMPVFEMSKLAIMWL